MRARALTALFDALPDEERLPIATFAQRGPLIDLSDRAAAVLAAVGASPEASPERTLLAVVDGERFVGVVGHARLAVAAASPRPLTIAAVVERGVPTVDAWSSVAAARAAIERSRRAVIAVTSGGTRSYVGLVRAEDLERLPPIKTRWSSRR